MSQKMRKIVALTIVALLVLSSVSVLITAPLM